MKPVAAIVGALLLAFSLVATAKGGGGGGGHGGGGHASSAHATSISHAEASPARAVPVAKEAPKSTGGWWGFWGAGSSQNCSDKTKLGCK